MNTQLPDDEFADRRPRASSPAALPPLAEDFIPVGVPRRRLLRGLLHLLGQIARVIFLPLLHPRLRWVTAAVAAGALLWSFDPARAAFERFAAAAGRPLHERAAFTWEGQFRDHRIERLELVEKTVSQKDYEMNFSARVHRRAIGWTVRGMGRSGSVVYKLIERARSSGMVKYELVRFVTNTEEPDKSQQYIVPLSIRPSGQGFLDITVRVTEDQVLTIINGFGVDSWKQPKWQPSDAGLLAENGEAFDVRSLTVSGNEDFLGLFLRGAGETIRSVKRNLASLVAARVR